LGLLASANSGCFFFPTLPHKDPHPRLRILLPSLCRGPPLHGISCGRYRVRMLHLRAPPLLKSGILTPPNGPIGIQLPPNVIHVDAQFFSNPDPFTMMLPQNFQPKLLDVLTRRPKAWDLSDFCLEWFFFQLTTQFQLCARVKSMPPEFWVV